MAPSLVAESPGVENHQEATIDGDIILDSALVISDPEFATIGGESFDWDDPDIDFAEVLNPQTNDEAFQYPSPRSSSFVRHWTPSTDQTVRVQQAVSLNVSIPAIPISTHRSLIQRLKMKTGAQRMANLILHILKSDPLMILRHDTLPPFVHPHLISSHAENNHTEPPTNCINLVHMISSGVQGSRKFF